MARPSADVIALTERNGRVRPAFDLTDEDLAILASLPPPFPQGRDARIAAVLAARYHGHLSTILPSEDRTPVTVPVERGPTRPVEVRLPFRTAAAFDLERGAASRGAFLRAILDTYKKASGAS